ncbi:anthrone oxygenase family protein [Nocardia sp. NPDC051030]|uniref:anthrone oxygenase family protein n=1 Tax=Nocardia sp. NPDC051030 TaxID=3155162 RepID=UPI0034433AFE
MFALRMAALVAATLASGLIAGVFYAYATSVMPALNQTDDKTFIDVMQRINVVIINPWFMIGFVGTVGFSVLAAALHLGKDYRTVLIWIAVATVLNVIAFAVTSGLNVPLNNQIANAGDVSQIADPAAVRSQFENTWVAWNIVRAVLHTLAFLVLTGALFQAGVQHAKANAAALPAGPAGGMVTGAQPTHFGQPGRPAPQGFSAPIAYAAPVSYAPQQRFAPGLQ